MFSGPALICIVETHAENGDLARLTRTAKLKSTLQFVPVKKATWDIPCPAVVKGQISSNLIYHSVDIKMRCIAFRITSCPNYAMHR